jgi:hypothetical protein
MMTASGGLRWAKAAAFALVTVGAIAGPAHADSIAITYSPAGQVQGDFAALCAHATTCDYGTENFANWTGGDFTSSFTTGAHSLAGGAMFTGQYSALDGTTTSQWVPMPQNQYGGVNGLQYPELFGPGALPGPPGQTESAYQITLTATGLPGGVGPNYFGVWISALDPFNDLQIYNTSNQLIAEFNSPTLISALGGCTSGPNSDCANPTPQFACYDPNELFAFVNVFDLNGSIGKVVLYDSGASGFESDNDTVACISPISLFGTSLPTPIAEPMTLSLLASSAIGLAMLRTRRRA